MFYIDNKPKKRNKNSSDSPVMMELENGKLILLGYLNYKNEFRLKIL